MQTRTQLLWELGVVLVAVAGLASQFLPNISWLPTVFFVAALLLIFGSWVYQFTRASSKTIRVVNAEVAFETDVTQPQMYIWMTFIANKDIALRKVMVFKFKGNYAYKAR